MLNQASFADLSQQAQQLGGRLLAEVVAGTAERFDVLAGIPQRKYLGGAMLRSPTLALGFFYIWLRDRLRNF